MKAAALALAALAVASGAVAADYRAPRNVHGQPDLEGVWNTNFVLPLEARPDAPALVVPPAEAKALARKWAAEAPTYASLAIDGEVAEIAAKAGEAGLGVVAGQHRTRQVVLPADGVIPMTPRARGQVRFVENVLRTSPEPPLPSANPEERPNWERCVVGQGQPPIAIVSDINPRQILLARDVVVILTEYGPDLRIIPFTDKHGPATFTGPLGDSIARWDGDTLVIETIRLPARDSIRPAPTFLVPASAVVEERYTRVGKDELLYQFTVRDPGAYSAPWLAEYTLARTGHPILEFACHEGNYSLPNILAGARAQERARAGAR